MATEVVQTLKVTPPAWLKVQATVSFGSTAYYVGLTSEAATLGIVTVVNKGATGYFVQVFDSDAQPLNGAVPAWTDGLPAGKGQHCVLDFFEPGGLQCVNAAWIAISTTGPTLTYPVIDDAVMSVIYAQLAPSPTYEPGGGLFVEGAGGLIQVTGTATVMPLVLGAGGSIALTGSGTVNLIAQGAGGSIAVTGTGTITPIVLGSGGSVAVTGTGTVTP